MIRTCRHCRKPVESNVVFAGFVSMCVIVYCIFSPCSQWHKIVALYPHNVMVKE